MYDTVTPVSAATRDAAVLDTEGHGDWSRIELHLFVSDNEASLDAVELVHRALHALGDSRYELTIVDVAKRPGLTASEHVLATPTLVRADLPGKPRFAGGFAAEGLLRAFLSPL